ncbi:universal stress protein [Natronospira bacteriovora]|uniref:Universal stress protein n=1 Tax=Natronospira bacteriovora TaxID=3069753 RepID=A0ABU0W8C4_9GAMM|nr:universal stress protein [Natronospira sp. AB-CW4]MDQ2070246.1 universal stress protein [Natronospira sp. AB-CW4]
MDIKHILAILDPEHAPRQGASRAARRAVDIAARTGARVTLAVFEDHQTIVESGVLGDALTREALDLWRQETESWLGRMKDGLESDGEVALHVGGGHPLADHVLKSIDEMQADLVIKDSHSESFLSRALFTPLDWHLLRRCPVPLMLTKSDGRDGLARVAAAVDPFHERGKPAELDQDILATAKSVAGWFGADVHAVHACQTQPLGAGSPIEGPSLQFEKVREEISKHHTRALRELSEAAGIDAEHSHFIDAPARRAIPDFTRDKEVDLLVMGTVTRKGLTRLIMGSTAEAILNDLGCDVLAIKPSGFAQAVKSS